MAFEIYLADKGLGVVLKKSEPSESIKSLADHLREFCSYNSGALLHIRYWLTDFTEVNEYEISLDDAWQISEITESIERQNKTMVIAICAPVFKHYCQARMWKFHLPEDIEWVIQIFRDRNEAKTWLQQTVQEKLTFQ